MRFLVGFPLRKDSTPAFPLDVFQFRNPPDYRLLLELSAICDLSLIHLHDGLPIALALLKDRAVLSEKGVTC